MTAPFGPALAIADAVLYEGYLLYPYTVSAPKNRIRWQFGVVVPQAYTSAGTGEPAEQQTEVLIEAAPDAVPRVTVLLRFLQVEARRVEARRGAADAVEEFEPVASLVVGGTTYLSFDEGTERQISAAFDAVPGGELVVPIAIGGSSDIELLREDAAREDGASCDTTRGRVVRERWQLAGTLTVRCDAVADRPALRKLRVRVENGSEVVAGERSGALRTALVSTHALLAVENGSFVSVLDPPAEAAAASAGLANRHVFPVLVGDAARDAQRAALVLSSPIILYDFPAVAKQSDADAFDATEVDELLMLSVLALPDAERAEACATDPRARAIVERAERFGSGELAQLHAATLYHAEPAADASVFPEASPTPAGKHHVFPGGPFAGGNPFAGSDPFAAMDVPALDCVLVNGVEVAKGSAVRLHPKRRADAWDMFLNGKVATVQAIHQDLEDVMYVAVTVDDDPASDLHEWYGRSFFFYPEEIEPLEDPR
ncbi:MAG: hypothetical protein QOI11_3829 [Candidatus Eremiobacteraeota bacterium]|jgi:hypothetical protein|nr:hypothetical protein [Candidatus Eremiobacteraeota bacterium]